MTGNSYEVRETKVSASDIVSSLTIKNARESQMGKYECVAKNSIGADETKVRVYRKFFEFLKSVVNFKNPMIPVNAEAPPPTTESTTTFKPEKRVPEKGHKKHKGSLKRQHHKRRKEQRKESHLETFEADDDEFGQKNMYSVNDEEIGIFNFAAKTTTTEVHLVLTLIMIALI